MQTVDLLFFKTKGCTLCAAQQGAVDIMAGETNSKINLTTIDIKKNPEEAEKWSVTKTPTMILVFPSTGAEIERKTGLVYLKDLRDWVNKYTS